MATDIRNFEKMKAVHEVPYFYPIGNKEHNHEIRVRHVVRSLFKQFGDSPEAYRPKLLSAVANIGSQNRLFATAKVLHAIANHENFKGQFPEFTFQELCLQRLQLGKSISGLLKNCDSVKENTHFKSLLKSNDEYMAAFLGYFDVLAQLQMQVGRTPVNPHVVLTFAVLGGHFDYIEDFAQKLIEVPAPNNGPSPVLAAVILNKPDVIGTLFAKGCSLSIPNRGILPIEYGMKHDKETAVKALLSLGSPLYFYTEFGQTRSAVTWIYNHNKIKYLNLLTTDPCAKVQRESGHLFFASLTTSSDLVKQFHLPTFELRAIESGDGRNVWTEFARQERIIKSVGLYLREHVDINQIDSRGHSVLDEIVTAHNVYEAPWFLTNGANLLRDEKAVKHILKTTAQNDVALQIARIAKDFDIINKGHFINLLPLDFVEAKRDDYIALLDSPADLPFAKLYDNIECHKKFRKCILPFLLKTYKNQANYVELWFTLLDAFLLSGDFPAVYALFEAKTISIDENDGKTTIKCLLSKKSCEMQSNPPDPEVLYAFIYQHFSFIQDNFGTIDRALAVFEKYPHSCGAAVTIPDLAILAPESLRTEYLLATGQFSTIGDIQAAIFKEGEDSEFFTQMLPQMSKVEISQRHIDHCPDIKEHAPSEENLLVVTSIRTFADHVTFASAEEEEKYKGNIEQLLSHIAKRSQGLGMPDKKDKAAFDRWYSSLEKNMRIVISKITQLNDKDHMSAAYRDFAWAGGMCGTEWVNAAEFWLELLFSPQTTLREKILLDLKKYRRGVVETISQELAPSYSNPLIAGLQAHLPNAVAKEIYETFGLKFRFEIYDDRSFSLSAEEKQIVRVGFNQEYSINVLTQMLKKLAGEQINELLEQGMPRCFTTVELEKMNGQLAGYVNKNSRDELLRLGVKIQGSDEDGETAIYRTTFAEHLLNNLQDPMWYSFEVPEEFAKQTLRMNIQAKYRIRAGETFRDTAFRAHFFEGLVDNLRKQRPQSVNALSHIIPNDFQLDIFDTDARDLDHLPKETGFETQKRIRLERYLEAIKYSDASIGIDLLKSSSAPNKITTAQAVDIDVREMKEKYVTELSRARAIMSKEFSDLATKHCILNRCEKLAEREKALKLPDPRQALQKYGLDLRPHETIKDGLASARTHAYLTHVYDEFGDLKLNGLYDLLLWLEVTESLLTVQELSQEEREKNAFVQEILEGALLGAYDAEDIERIIVQDQKLDVEEMTDEE